MPFTTSKPFADHELRFRVNRNASVRLALLVIVAIGCGSSESDSTGLPDTSGTGPREGTTPGGVIVVDEINRELAILRETHYQHPIRVDELQGTFDLDCSGFTDYVIARVMPAHFRELAAASRPRPLAQHYVSFFGDMRAPSWEPVSRVADLVPGDFVAWVAPSDSSNTGHIVVVRENPSAQRDGSFRVPMWDATSKPHGDEDPRAAQGATGVGEATIVLFVDARGAPNAHAWSVGAQALSERIAMGRAR